MKIVSYIRFALWTRLFKQWLTQKFDSISIDLTPVANKIDSLDEKLDSLDEKITPYFYDECSVEEVNHMFETLVLDGYVFIPSNAINSNGTMPVSVFEAITDFTLE